MAPEEGRSGLGYVSAQRAACHPGDHIFPLENLWHAMLTSTGTLPTGPEDKLVLEAQNTRVQENKPVPAPGSGPSGRLSAPRAWFGAGIVSVPTHKRLVVFLLKTRKREITWNCVRHDPWTHRLAKVTKFIALLDLLKQLNFGSCVFIKSKDIYIF